MLLLQKSSCSMHPDTDRQFQVVDWRGMRERRELS